MDYAFSINEIRERDHHEFENACVNFHNFIRLVHNAPLLTWSETLEVGAQAWAQHLNAIQVSARFVLYSHVFHCYIKNIYIYFKIH
jgi:hypothetical protein